MPMSSSRKRFHHAMHLALRAARHTWAGACLLTATTAASGAAINALVTDRNNAPVNDAVIYAMPVTGALPARPPRGAIIDQINREFMPYVTPVQAGSAVSFPNRDSIRHHVYSFSPAKTFELKLQSGVPAAPVVFEKPGAVVLGCNIHDWMLAYVYVVDTPYFAKTVNGNMRLDGLPAGDYEVKVWHPQLRSPVPAQLVKLGANGAPTVKFALELLPKPSTGTPPPAR
jgi:plastocyanin